MRIHVGVNNVCRRARIPCQTRRKSDVDLSEALTIFLPALSYKTNTSMLLVSSDATNAARRIIGLTR